MLKFAGSGKLGELNNKIKELEKERKDLRAAFFDAVTDHALNFDPLPTKTIEVPQSFWIATDMNPLAFVSSRFPGWIVEATEVRSEDDSQIFVLRRDPQYMTGEADGDGYILRKSISEYTPEIDWVTLKAEKPDLFDRLAKSVVKYELDEEALDKEVAENPEVLAILPRHLKTKAPYPKLTVSKAKGE